MTDNVIDFSNYINANKTGIDNMAAKKYFIEQVLPYVGDAGLQRLLQAELSGDRKAIKLEMARLYVEAELARPDADPSSLKEFFLFSEAREVEKGKNEK